MFNSGRPQQTRLEMVNLEDLVPQDHLLRKIDRYIDFGFIAELTRELYCEDNGRPCLDPIILFKMIFVGYLFGIRSERRLVKEIEVNLAYRWFLGLGLTEPVPHHSTISQNRRRRFNGTTVFQEVFDQIVLQALEYGLVEGKELFADSTFLKANASKSKYVRKTVRKSARRYVQELDRAVNQDRQDHGKPPLPPKTPRPRESETRVSTTDPDSGFMVRDGKPRGFFYLDHRTVDGRWGIITDTYVTPGNVHDSVPFLERLDRQLERFKLKVEAVALDAGYLTNAICHGLRQRDIFGVIAHRRFHPQKGLMHKWQYKYDAEQDVYRCKAGHELVYRTTNRAGYREYRSNPKVCCNCELLDRCTHSKTHTKTITRHVWEDDKEWVRQNRLSEPGKRLYQRRKETVERSFADSKELHGLRYCRMRGLTKVAEQSLLTAACQNMKKIANALWKRDNGPAPGPNPRLLWRQILERMLLSVQNSKPAVGMT